MQLEDLSEGKFIDRNLESGHEEKSEDIPEEVTLAKNFTLKELSEMPHDVEITKNRMLVSDTNLKRNMTVFQSTEKMLAEYKV